MLKRMGALSLAGVLLVTAPSSLRAAEFDDGVLKAIDRSVEQWRLDSHVPGLVYGVVKDGRLIVVKGQGVQDTTSKRPVDAQCCFASPR